MRVAYLSLSFFLKGLKVYCGISESVEGFEPTIIFRLFLVPSVDQPYLFPEHLGNFTL